MQITIRKFHFLALKLLSQDFNDINDFDIFDNFDDFAKLRLKDLSDFKKNICEYNTVKDVF